MDIHKLESSVLVIYERTETEEPVNTSNYAGIQSTWLAITMKKQTSLTTDVFWNVLLEKLAWLTVQHAFNYLCLISLNVLHM